jgi:hypothetical protein
MRASAPFRRPVPNAMSKSVTHAGATKCVVDDSPRLVLKLGEMVAPLEALGVDFVH